MLAPIGCTAQCTNQDAKLPTFLKEFTVQKEREKQSHKEGNLSGQNMKKYCSVKDKQNIQNLLLAFGNIYCIITKDRHPTSQKNTQECYSCHVILTVC